MANDKTFLGQTGEMKAGHAFDVARLAAYLEANLEGYAGPLAVSQFEGGQSNPTYLLTTPGAKYVLRRKPPGVLLPSAHAVDREFRVMRALSAVGYPTPTARLLCDDDSVVGTMFFVMDHVDGRVFWDPILPGVEAADRTSIYDDMADRLADLHAVDWRAAGLEGFGRPENYFARQIGRWSKQYEQSTDRVIPEMDKLIAWLPTAIPQDDEACLIHGDYGLHNLLIGRDTPRIAAVLDWELSTIGHPVSDLVYCAIPWYRPDVPDGRSSFQGVDLAALGIPTLEAFVDRYCQRAGRKPIENLAFYCAFNLFRSAAIGVGIAARARQGSGAGSDGAKLAEVALGPYVQGAWAQAQKAGAG